MSRDWMISTNDPYGQNNITLGLNFALEMQNKQKINQLLINESQADRFEVCLENKSSNEIICTKDDSLQSHCFIFDLSRKFRFIILSLWQSINWCYGILFPFIWFTFSFFFIQFFRKRKSLFWLVQPIWSFCIVWSLFGYVAIAWLERALLVQLLQLFNIFDFFAKGFINLVQCFTIGLQNWCQRWTLWCRCWFWWRWIRFELFPPIFCFNLMNNF